MKEQKQPSAKTDPKAGRKQAGELDDAKLDKVSGGTTFQGATGTSGADTQGGTPNNNGPKGGAGV